MVAYVHAGHLLCYLCRGLACYDEGCEVVQVAAVALADGLGAPLVVLAGVWVPRLYLAAVADGLSLGAHALLVMRCGEDWVRALQLREACWTVELYVGLPVGALGRRALLDVDAGELVEGILEDVV